MNTSNYTTKFGTLAFSQKVGDEYFWEASYQWKSDFYKETLQLPFSVFSKSKTDKIMRIVIFSYKRYKEILHDKKSTTELMKKQVNELEKLLKIKKQNLSPYAESN